jgi:protein TonB
MFEDSLVESASRIRTRSRRYAAGSLVLETALVSVIVMIPYLYPDALPRKFLSVPLNAPPPAPDAPVAEPQHAVAALHTELLRSTLLAPTQIPHHIPDVADSVPPGLNISGAADIGGSRGGAVGALPLDLSTPPPISRVHPAKPAGPVRVSAGVAAGQLIVPIQPQYPAIARQIRLQGTVVVSAVISTDGRIESLRVLSGPPLLVNAAVQAIRQARYRPWQLNGEPVEVQTTINVVFSFGGD